MKFFQKKSERLTAAEARAIPIDDDYINPIFEKIYHKIRFAASRGDTKVYYYYLEYPDAIQEYIKQRLEFDGYKVKEFAGNDFVHVGEWLISWEESK